MKHGVLMRVIVFFLAAMSLLAAAAGALGIVAMESADLYIGNLDEIQEREYGAIAREIAEETVSHYAVREFGNLPYKLLHRMYPDPEDRSDADFWCVSLSEGDKVLVAPSWEQQENVWEFTISPHYPLMETFETEGEVGETSSEDAPQDSKPSVPKGWLYHKWEFVLEEITSYHLYYYQGPTYTVRVQLQPEVLENSSVHLISALYPLRYAFIVILALGLMAFAAGMVYLCWSAGRTVDGQIQPEGMNRLPLDLHFTATVIGILVLMMGLSSLWQWTMDEGAHPGNLSLIAIDVLGIIFLGMSFLCAVSAQIKIQGAYWWHHSAVGWLVGKLGWLLRQGVKAVQKVLSLLPVIWQWLLTAAGMVFSVCLTFWLYDLSRYSEGMGPVFFCGFLLAVFACVAMILYGGYAFGVLLLGARKMARGELSHKIPVKYLRGVFLDFALQMNALSDNAMEAAQERIRSERMKTELITNVSHDIKTPLTSIINFVDLLQKPHTPREEEQYLEVLERQSSRMKRLIEDLMELSKASSGNLQVDFTRLDAGEAVQQALGEFSDKLEAAQLHPVFRQPEVPVHIWGDGKLVWRVLSNLFSNAVKYAMPGTRVYLELEQDRGKVMLSMKNVTREPLRCSTEELLERFVQGDISRNTGGSGLGLNIALSLMEVQKGAMTLEVDGDLFKVILTFQEAKE